MTPDNKQPSEIYTEGLQAHTNGAPADANPYPAESEQFAAWKRGWESVGAPFKDLPPDELPPVEAPTG